MIKILFFAKCRELAGRPGLNLHIEGVTTVAGLVRQLGQHLGEHSAFLGDPKILVSVNQQLCTRDTEVKSGDEVAFFPPVTGG